MTTKPATTKRSPSRLSKWIFMAMLPALSFGQNSRLAEKKGFRDFLFGTAPGRYQNLMLELNEGNTKLFTLQENTIDGIDYDYIRLTFHKDKLSVISMKTKGSNGERLLKYLTNEYGEPAQKDTIKNKYTWSGNKIRLVYEGKNNDATVSFYNDAIY
jgi:hypothetical protein